MFPAAPAPAQVLPLCAFFCRRRRWRRVWDRGGCCHRLLWSVTTVAPSASAGTVCSIDRSIDDSPRTLRVSHTSSDPLLPLFRAVLLPRSLASLLPRTLCYPPHPVRGTSFEESKPAEQPADRKAGSFGSVGENRGGGTGGGGGGAVGQAAGAARGVAWATGAEDDKVRKRGRREGREGGPAGGLASRRPHGGTDPADTFLVFWGLCCSSA